MLFLKKILGCLMQKGKDNDVEQQITLDDVVSAPIEKGQKLGEVTYLLDGEVISTVNLVANNTVKKLNFGNMLAHVVESWFKLLR